MASCCDGGHGHGELDEYEIHGHDPTLSSCCMKDMKEQKEYVRIHTILKRHDIAEKRLAERHLAPSSLPQPVLTSNAMVFTEEEEDEYDYLLEDNPVDIQRRHELQEKIAQRQNGLGIVWGDEEFISYQARLNGNKWQQLIQSKQDRPVIVACRPVTLENDQQEATTINIGLLNCAEKYLGTCVFAVSQACISRIQDLSRNTLKSPVLVAFTAEGQFISQMPLSPMDEEIWEGRVMPWLKKCNVLREEYTQTSLAANAKSAPSEEIEDSNGYDCGIDKCRLRHGYYHEHVGPSAETKREISEWRR